MEQEICFCITPDGARIAYATMGQGPALVYPPAWISHLEVMLEDPACRAFFEGLARHHTFVWYDKRGCGLSDRDRTDFSLQAEVADLEAVIEHLKLERLALIGVSQGGPVSVAYTAKHPQRITNLILYDTYGCGDTLAKDEVKASLLSLVRAHWGLGSKTLADVFIPHGDVDDVEYFTKWQRESATAEMAADLLASVYRDDVTELLPSISVPTLVMHRQKDRAIPFRLGRELAASIPNARFVPLEGSIHMPWWGDFDSVLQAIAEFLGHAEVSTIEVSEEPGADLVAEEPAAQEAHSFVSDLDVIALSRYRVVGSYTRYDEASRHTLKDAWQKVTAALEKPSRKRENHIIWAAPGSGKTYFVQQVADSLSDAIRYREINLAKCSEQEFTSSLSGLDKEDRPVLCLIDEVDAKPDEKWPYEMLLPYLDAAVERGTPFVFVLAGSSGSRLDEMKQRMTSRPKGSDLLSRIPGVNEYEIQSMGIGDRLLVALSQFRVAGRERSREIRAVEKLGLYYLTVSPRLANARQLREFAVRGVERVPTGEDRVKYDDLFSAGDPENKAFYMQSLPAAEDLVNRFVMIED